MKFLHKLLCLAFSLAVTGIVNAQNAPYVAKQIPPANLVSGGGSATMDLTPFFALKGVRTPIVHFEFDNADLWIKLSSEETPLTVANFRNYVTSGRYNGIFLHRAEAGFVIQGGGYSYNGDNFISVTQDAPVPNEFYFGNLAGTIAMATVAGDINSATSDWFFNLEDNLFLDANDQRFTVFGRLIGNGLITARQLGAVPTRNLNEVDPETGLPDTEAPLHSVPLVSENGNDYLITLTKVEEVPLLARTSTLTGYLGVSVTTSNPAVIVPSLTPGGLKLTTGAPGVASISVQVTDPYGQTATTSFVATSTPVYYQLKVVASPAARGAVSGAGNFIKNSVRIIRAVPKRGSVFKYWMLNGKIVSVKAAYAVPMNTNKVLVAVFK